ncbi:MAG: hemolysin family protein [Proteobacteria bacterium]|nr:hemolysin family protein [Pseudomonadota bacterium]
MTEAGMHPELGWSLVGLLSVAALILTNAYFVATEFALVAVRRSQVTLWLREGRRGAAAVARSLETLDDAIAATQLGITVASIGLGWIGEPAIAGLLRPGLASIGLESEAAVHTAAVGIAFALITFLHVVLGELAPKAVALDQPGPVALICAAPLLIFGRIFRPLLAVMNGAGNAVVRLLGVPPASSHEAAHSPEELSLLVTEASDAGRIRPYTSRILGNVFRTVRTRVSDVMVPRAGVFAIEKSIAPDELLDALRDRGYTRIPVYEGELDNVVGILHAKDLFHVYAREGVVILPDAVRPVVEIGPDVPIIDALRFFRGGRKHLALVRRPNGPLLGVVTLEDVLEELVGEIEDEYDVPTPAGSE